MSIPAIAPSPVARLLLELESRRATAGLDVGGRRVVLSEGVVVDVRPYGSDPSLGTFLVESSRLSADELSRAQSAAAARGVQLETVLRDDDLIDAESFAEVRRALWLDRLVRGLSSEEERASGPSAVTPEPNPPSGAGVTTLPFVLDALARRAGFDRDAERVGQLASTWFEWRSGAEATRARNWAGLGQLDEPVLTAQLFSRHPAAPSRIAALVRAGLAHLSEGKPLVPQPETRPPAIVGPVHDPRSAEIAPEVRQQAVTIDPARSAARPLGIAKVASWLPPPSGTLDDPLDPLERRIAQLEQSGAPAADRARAWLELAEAFRFHFDSIDESTRASREAAAAEPSFVDALDAAAGLSASVGKPDHAYQYARALADALTDDHDARANSLIRAYHYGRRAKLTSNALGALRDAHALVPDHPAIAELSARAAFEQGDRAQGIALARKAARAYAVERPEQALFVLWWANELAPTEPALAADLSALLGHTGRHEAALAVANRSARLAGDQGETHALVVDTAQRTEQAGRPDLAFDSLLEALDRASSGREELWDRILKTLTSVGSAADLAVLALLASREGDAALRADRLALAADARLVLPGESSLAIELFTRALEAVPNHPQALASLAQLSKAEGQKRALMDALERAIAQHRDDPDTLEALLEQLIALALRPTDGAPALARALLKEYGALVVLDVDKAQIEQRANEFAQIVTQLEQTVRSAQPGERIDTLMRAAMLMRDDPSLRGKARKMLEYVLEKRPEHAEASLALEGLLRVTGEREALQALLVQRAQVLDDAASRGQLLLKQVYTALLDHDDPLALRALEALLGELPRHREGLALLTRIGTVDDPEALKEALERRLEVGLDPRERARTAVALALIAVRDREPGIATRLAELALTLDPRNGEAALLVLDHHELLDTTRRAAHLRVAHAILGAGPVLMRALAQACFAAQDPRGQRTALETYARFSPFEALPALGLCALHATGQDARALASAVRLAIDPGRVRESTAEAVRTALARLWTIANPQDVSGREVANLLLDATDALGEHGSGLLSWALPFVRSVGDARLVRAVLERLIARVRGEARRAELRRLAHVCREQNMRVAEARAYLRLLAVEPSDDEALARLSTIYAETREVERLMAVLTVRLNGARDAEERRSRLLSLALTSLDLASDPSTAVTLLRAALAPEVLPDGTTRDCPLPSVRRGVGMLLGAGCTKEAFDLMLELSAEATPERGCLLIAEAVVVAEEDLGDADLSVRAAMLGLESFPDHGAFLEHIERVAPALGDLAALRDTYKQLSESAAESDRRKAILARGAYVLEGLGALDDALDLAERVLALSPSDQLALQHLERLSQAAVRPEPWIRALVQQAGQEPAAEARAGLLARAARLSEDDANDLGRAALLSIQAYEALPSAEHESYAMSVLGRLSEHAAGSAHKAAEAMRDALTRAAKDHDAPADRLRALTTLAELSLDIQRDDADASSYASAARSALEQIGDIAEDERDALRTRIDGILARTSARREGRISTQTGSIQRNSEPKPSVAAAVRARRLADADQELRALDDTETFTLSATPHGGIAIARAEAERNFALAARNARVELLSAEDEGIVRGVMHGSAAALERLTSARDNNFARSAVLCEALLVAVRSEGPNLSALRGLRALADHLRRRDLAAVVGEAFAFCDPLNTERTVTRLPSPNDEATRGALVEAREDGALAPAFAVLYHVYTAAMPLFRRPLANHGVAASDFVGHGEYGARGEALQDVTRILGLEYEAYLATSGRGTIDVALTAPASIIIGGEVPAERIPLRFRLAAAFERARPQNALLACLAEQEAEVLVTAIRAAFIAPDGEAVEVPREPAALAAELWRTMPGQAQRQVEQTLRGMSATFEARELRAQLARRAARVGLVVCGSLAVALDQLGVDDEPRPMRVPNTEAAFAEALAERADVRDLVSFALSDAYLALRSRESS